MCDKDAKLCSRLYGKVGAARLATVLLNNRSRGDNIGCAENIYLVCIPYRNYTSMKLFIEKVLEESSMIEIMLYDSGKVSPRGADKA